MIGRVHSAAPFETAARAWRAIAAHDREAAELFGSAAAALTTAEWHGGARAGFDALGEYYRGLIEAGREQAEAVADALDVVAGLVRLAGHTARVYGGVPAATR